MAQQHDCPADEIRTTNTEALAMIINKGDKETLDQIQTGRPCDLWITIAIKMPLLLRICEKFY